MSMTQGEIDEFLSAPRLCHFATVDDAGQPRVRPLWFLWRGGAMWLTTRLKARHTGRDLAGGGPVAISVASEDRPYRAVVLHGKPEVIGRDEKILLDIATRYGEESGRAFVGRSREEKDRVVLRVAPDRIYSWDYGKTA